MVQAVGRRNLTAEAWGPSRASLSQICGGQSCTGAGFSRSILIPLTGIIPPNINTPFIYMLPLPELQTSETFGHTKSNAVSEIEAHLTQKPFHSFSLQRLVTEKVSYPCKTIDKVVKFDIFTETKIYSAVCSLVPYVISRDSVSSNLKMEAAGPYETRR
jgi:hypothetical protein